MKVVLDIKNEVDLTILLPLLERLKIPFSLPENSIVIKRASGTNKATANSKRSMAKNFDLAHLETLFDELQAMNAFSQIEDPIAWQRRIRDEWN